MGDQTDYSLVALVEQRCADIKAAVRRHKGRTVALFGSVARAEETPDELADLLGRPVDVVSSGGLKPRDHESEQKRCACEATGCQGMTTPPRTGKAPSIEVLRERRDEIFALARRYGASNVRVFGSVARGDAGVDSDIDLIVDLEPDRSLLDLAGLHLDLMELLDREIDVGTAGSIRERIRDRVLSESVPL